MTRTGQGDMIIRQLFFPSPFGLFGVGERLTVSAGIAADLHTFTRNMAGAIIPIH